MTMLIFADGSVEHRDTNTATRSDDHNRRVLDGRLTMLLADHVRTGGTLEPRYDGRPGGPFLALSVSSPGRGVRKALRSVERTQDGLVWMPESEARKALGPSRYRKVQGMGLLKRKRIGSRRWVVRRADVLAVLNGDTPRAGADETIARAVVKARSAANIPRHTAGVHPDVRASDDHADDEQHVAYRQRRRYRRGR